MSVRDCGRYNPIERVDHRDRVATSIGNIHVEPVRGQHESNWRFADGDRGCDVVGGGIDQSDRVGKGRSHERRWTVGRGAPAGWLQKRETREVRRGEK